MRRGPVNTLLACLYFFICSSALPRSKSDYSQSDVAKGQTNWLGISSKEEPSCDELKVMWRFSKRQSRAAEITNEIPTYRDPFVYNVWDDYPRPRSAGVGVGGGVGRGSRYRRPIFGKVIHNLPKPLVGAFMSDNSPERIRAFEQVARLFSSPMIPMTRVQPQRKTSFRLGGGGVGGVGGAQEPLSGSFQHLKEMIIAERARELQEQRLSEEAAARAEALKDVVGNIHFGRIVQDEKVHPLTYGHPTDGNSAEADSHSPSTITRNRGIVAFPDLLAPASSRYSLLPSSPYKHSSYNDDSIGADVESNEWATW